MRIAVTGGQLAMFRPVGLVTGDVYNIARSDSTSILEDWQTLREVVGISLEPTFTNPRPGVARHGRARVDAAWSELGLAAVTTVAGRSGQYCAWTSRSR